jgi:hypothetical protein
VKGNCMRVRKEERERSPVVENNRLTKGRKKFVSPVIGHPWQRIDSRGWRTPSGVEVVLQWCSSGVRVVLHCCCSGLIAVLQRCYSGVVVVLHWVYSGVTVVSQSCYSAGTVKGRLPP